jgi:toxin ParE1/3/4
VVHRVVFAPEAQADPLELYDYIADRGGRERAISYVERLEAACAGLSLFPQRGRRRDDFRPGLRIIGFGRRVNIAFSISNDSIFILRVLYGGRDPALAVRRTGS